MYDITVQDVLSNTSCKLLIGDKNKILGKCFINSKETIKGGTFIGIKGNTDGSLYYKDAFDNGCDICILNKIYDLDLKGYDDKTVLIAEDTIKVLHELASYKRSLFKGKVIGITGSVGKTSTKELISNVLETKYKVLKTIGNKNSQIGLPLSILNLKDEDVMVIEMGMSYRGEMKRLSNILKPDIAVITNILSSHIGNLDNRSNILKEKLHITDYINNGNIIINNDNDLLYSWGLNNKCIKIGINNKSDIMASNIKEGIYTTFDIVNLNNVKIHGPIDYVYNALIAYKIGNMFNIDNELIKESISNYINVSHRLEVIKLKDITIIDDTYNSCYESVKAALKYLSNYDTRRIAILGDILELGNKAKEIHKSIAKDIMNNDIDLVITIGKYSKHINKELRRLGMKKNNMKHFKNEALSRTYINNNIKANDTILVKASNGIGLDKLVNYIISLHK